MLWPQVVAEVAPVPVLAAGGIGSGQQIAAALALGCQGAWTGLAVADGRGGREHAGPAAGATSRRPRATPCAVAVVHRQAVPDAAQRLDRGLGGPRDNPSRSACRCSTWCRASQCAATHRYPDQTVDVAFNPVGQVVGQFTKVEKTAAVIERWVEEYLEATGRLEALNQAAMS